MLFGRIILCRMKKCRHCGRENEDGLTMCVECGLEMSPSPARRFLAKLPSAIGAIDPTWPQRILVGLCVLFAVLVVYLLSLGPILRFYGVRPSSGWNRLPAIVRIVYEPIKHMPMPESMARMLRGYNRWWLRGSSVNTDYVRQMAQIDRSITVGMSQSDVVRMLGKPLMWYTNGDCLVADYSFPPPITDFDVLTNGFRIEFSNGMVVGKSPNTVLSGSAD